MHENKVTFKVYGKYGLFSDPIMRVGGEKVSYPFATYQALVGICDSIYYKPTIKWYVDRVRVMNRIQLEAKSVRPTPFFKGTNTLSKYAYLVDPTYIVEAHFEWNENRPDLMGDRNENKHHEIAKRAIKEGGRKDVFLGTRECQCYVEPCSFDEGRGYYDNDGIMSFGLMLHSFEYANDSSGRVEKVHFWNPIMENGVIRFPRPDNKTELITRDLTQKKEG